MKKTLKRLGSMLLAITMVLSFTACGNSTDNPGTSKGGSSGTSSPTENKEKIRIGLACALSGSSAAYGDLQHWAANLAADEINAAGGINDSNAYEYAQTGADVLVTSWVYFGRPFDIKMKISSE